MKKISTYSWPEHYPFKMILFYIIILDRILDSLCYTFIGEVSICLVISLFQVTNLLHALCLIAGFIFCVTR